MGEVGNSEVISSNPQATGSNPVGRTINIKALEGFTLRAFQFYLTYLGNPNYMKGQFNIYS